MFLKLAAHGYTGIVHQYIDLAEGFKHGTVQVLQVLLFGNIRRNSQDGIAILTQIVFDIG